MARSRKSDRAASPGGQPLLFDQRPDAGGNGQAVALHEAARTRYLNYALSVITSRALPDVRDGLKPVQRRILYTMWQQHLHAGAKPRKCAKVVGDVMGSYHPHGDTAIYDALVRLAQPFALSYPLVDGSGNFGSLDGDSAAAMRYTECRLAALSNELLDEIGQDTVPFRPNYDGTHSEPVVLPARMANLLVNGTTGIAVGMATNIPPHHLGEICQALGALLRNPELQTQHLCRTVKGPDFPTGGQILNTPGELLQIYKTGSGPIRLRATYQAGPVQRQSRLLYVSSVPYAVNKAQLVEQIGKIIAAGKLPPLVNVKDLSTEDVRIELELKKQADHGKVMAYLFKHTALQTNFNVNLTCLVPTENPEVGRPERCDLRQILQHFLNFRLQVVARRLQHALRQLDHRIHILEGLARVFDVLDQIIETIRSSDGKEDAAAKIIKKFELDADQTDAILELKLYRLARLELLAIGRELDTKRRRAAQIKRTLASDQALRELVGQEIDQIRKSYGCGKRRTRIKAAGDEPQYDVDDFVAPEDNHVLLTQDGWIKRQKEIRDAGATRLREGDQVLAFLLGSTRASCVLLTSYGTAYTCRIVDIPATSGYGEPVQKLFKLKDGERVVAAFSLDARASGRIAGAKPAVHALAVTDDGYSFRFSFEPYLEPSNRFGRRYARLASGARITGVESIGGSETIIAATTQARLILCRADQVNFLAGPGRGVRLIRLAPDDRVIGFCASASSRAALHVVTNQGTKRTITSSKYELTGRGGKGRQLMKRGRLVAVVPRPLAPPTFDG